MVFFDEWFCRADAAARIIEAKQVRGDRGDLAWRLRAFMVSEWAPGHSWSAAQELKVSDWHAFGLIDRRPHVVLESFSSPWKLVVGQHNSSWKGLTSAPELLWFDCRSAYQGISSGESTWKERFWWPYYYYFPAPVFRRSLPRLR